MDDEFENVLDQLTHMLREAGLRPTLDPQRNNTYPCIVCGREAAPGRPNHLITIGTRRYENDDFEEPLRRPVCGYCKETTKWGSEESE